MEKIILDLCGGTGAWSLPYKEAGYITYNITLPDYDLIRTGYECGGYIIFKGKKFLRICLYDVYGILAAPDCAHFSFARQRAKTPRDIPGAFALVKKCREIIEVCALEGYLKFWCLENPKGYLYKILGKPAFSFERWHFGDLGNKLTHTWGDFNFPKMKPKPELKDGNFMSSGCWKKIEIPSGCRKKGDDSLKIKRAMTPPGFAKAFFKANK